mmetsp:Transcript_22579/g.50844  ORF Transcript_22579/g.50844 Transcript_22579/m.50844 type:complete len:222 (+) Transcript_22579:1597-2262(+)
MLAFSCASSNSLRFRSCLSSSLYQAYLYPARLVLAFLLLSPCSGSAAFLVPKSSFLEAPFCTSGRVDFLRMTSSSSGTLTLTGLGTGGWRRCASILRSSRRFSLCSNRCHPLLMTSRASTAATRTYPISSSTRGISALIEDSSLFKILMSSAVPMGTTRLDAGVPLLAISLIALQASSLTLLSASLVSLSTSWITDLSPRVVTFARRRRAAARTMPSGSWR